MPSIMQTNLRMLHYLVQQHPQLAAPIEKLAAKQQGRNYDIDLLLTFIDDFLSKSNTQYTLKFKEILSDSNSQIFQDIFVLYELNFIRNGFFVEFGATDGVKLSNTYLLEKKFGWNGILAEPATYWHNDLINNRTSNIETKCVWIDSNSRLTFKQSNIPELSSIDTFSSKDQHSKARKNGISYEVETISLYDLLKKYNAPACIDYLSIDTEGSEYDILAGFNFNEYEFKVITCEHNFTSMREDIHKLLSSKGYTRKFENLSKFDDWYVKCC